MGADKAIRQSTPQNVHFAGTPDSAVENAVIRMRCTTALVKPRYLSVRQGKAPSVKGSVLSRT